MDTRYSADLQAAIDRINEAFAAGTRTDELGRKAAEENVVAEAAIVAAEQDIQKLRANIQMALVESGETNPAALALDRKKIAALHAEIAKNKELIEDRQSLIVGLAKKRAEADATLQEAAEALRPLAKAYVRDVFQAHAEKSSAEINAFAAGLRRGMALASWIKIGSIAYGLDKVFIPNPLNPQTPIISSGRIHPGGASRGEDLATSWREHPELVDLVAPVAGLLRLEARLATCYATTDNRKAAERAAAKAAEQAAIDEEARQNRELAAADAAARQAEERAAKYREYQRRAERDRLSAGSAVRR